jgi:P-type Ca2+ transporter type 2C
MADESRPSGSGNEAVQETAATADVDEALSGHSAGSASQWHSRPLRQLLNELGAEPKQGLSAAEALDRLKRLGPNELRRQAGVTLLSIFVAQFRSLIVWILIGAAVVSIALGETVDGLAIAVIVLLNALFGFYQEFRAERAAAALAHLVAPRARVVRDGRSLMIPAAEVVRGDILLLEPGDLVAADARLIEAERLHAEEAPLTGESQPVPKAIGDQRPETPLADRSNMVFLATTVVAGTGRGVVVATGMETEVGHIAGLLETADAGETPLLKRLDLVGQRLLWTCLGIVLIVFLLGLLRSMPLYELFLASVSLAVAAIPEGLPAAVTVALALGTQRMARRNALVKRLPAVETLGCAQFICTDKTGTLTVGEMTARRAVTGTTAYAVTGEGYAPQGAFFIDGQEIAAGSHHVLGNLLRTAVACNDAELTGRTGRDAVVGDPTEVSLLVAAAKHGIRREALEAEFSRIGGVPFDSDRKRMTVVRALGEQAHAFAKGAPETILDRCSHILTERGAEPLSESDRARMLQASAVMATDALRVLAFAERPLGSLAGFNAKTPGADEIENGMIFLGLIGLQDPPRAEARDAVAKCRRAGIRIVMITGDHPDTARAIAREIGILDRGDEALTGTELACLDDRELTERVLRTAVYARVTAADKLRIVRAWKRRDAVVAMTGDGVNDAPALKEASIGIAMGITGTEVTKQSADIIITDDNFASIAAAVEEGRGIYDNIAQTLGYLLAGNAAELMVMLLAALVGWPMPLLPIHLLWINLVTDGLPALALATDPPDRDVLSRPPRHPRAQLLDIEFVKTTAITGGLTALVTLSAFAFEYFNGGGVENARDAAFTVLVFSELFRSFGARSNVQPVWQLGLFTNIRLFAVVLASFLAQLIIHHVPAMQHIFGITPMSVGQGVVWIALGAIPLVLLETRKLLRGVGATGSPAPLSRTERPS